LRVAGKTKNVLRVAGKKRRGTKGRGTRDERKKAVAGCGLRVAGKTKNELRGEGCGEVAFFDRHFFLVPTGECNTENSMVQFSMKQIRVNCPGAPGFVINRGYDGIFLHSWTHYHGLPILFQEKTQ